MTTPCKDATAASPWFYHGSITAAEADELLTRVNREGAFLVRDSETAPGGFSLCLWHDGRVHKYRILREPPHGVDGGPGGTLQPGAPEPEPGTGNRLFVKAEAGVEERKYDSLDQLIEDYVSRKGQNGLVAPLQVPVACRRGESFAVGYCGKEEVTLGFGARSLKLECFSSQNSAPLAFIKQTLFYSALVAF